MVILLLVVRCNVLLRRRIRMASRLLLLIVLLRRRIRMARLLLLLLVVSRAIGTLFHYLGKREARGFNLRN
jgi:hypothetical protein